MATNFPGSLDNGTSLPYPSAGNFTNGPSLAGGQDNQNDALIAVETKLGTGSSTPSGSNLLVSTGTGTSAWSKIAPTGTIVGTTDSQTLTNKIITSPTISAPTITNATISADVLSGFTTSNNGTVYGVGITGGVITTANSIGNTALQTNAVQANQLATNAITLGYAQITTTFATSNTTATQVTGLTITVTIPAGARKIKITVWATDQFCSNGPVGVGSQVSIWDGTVGSGTKLANNVGTQSAAGSQYPSITMAIATPGAGSKTYNVGLLTSNATYAANMEASSTSPAFILVEAI